VTPRNLTILLLVLAAALAAGCGADEETKPSIPPASAQSLNARLAEVQRRFEVGGGACDDITNDSQPAVQTILTSLPSSVDKDVRSALTESFDRLFELAAEQCDSQQTQTDTTPTTDTTETTETTDTTTTDTTDTTHTDTTPTDSTPTTETTPPPTDENGDGNGNGNSNGNGNGGGSPGPGL
jgi:hypothetical protein